MVCLQADVAVLYDIAFRQGNRDMFRYLQELGCPWPVRIPCGF